MERLVWHAQNAYYPTSIIAGAISQPVRVTATICAGTISYAVTPTTIAVASIVILELFTSISPIISSCRRVRIEFVKRGTSGSKLKTTTTTTTAQLFLHNN